MTVQTTNEILVIVFGAMHTVITVTFVISINQNILGSS